MKKIFSLLLLLPVLALLSACQTNLASDTYSDQTAGQAQTVYFGKILSAQPVQVTGNSGVGAIAGAAAGGIGASFIGGDTRTNLLTGLGGALIGGMIGNAADKKLHEQTAVRYVIELEGVEPRQALSIVQGFGPDKSMLAVGTRVMVLTGGANPARIVPA